VDVEQFGRIGVLMGGYSSEREISLRSGRAIYEALAQEGCRVVAVDLIDQERDKIKNTLCEAKMDLAFIALHGRLGEDGEIQKILEEMDIAYVGSDPQASRFSFDKEISQKIFKKNQLNVPDHRVISQKEDLARIVLEWKIFPVVVKPTCEGSSIGVSLVETKQALLLAMQAAFKYGDKILLEKYIKGRELTVGILDDCALPVIEICVKRTFFDYTAKYEKGETQYLIPAPLDEKIAIEIQTAALKAHRALGCEDLSRVDFILSEENVAYILEVNNIPGFTATSLLPKAAKQLGMTFNQLCLKLVQLAYGKKTKNNISFRS